MKRYIKQDAELRAEFPGKIIYHSESDADSGVQIKLSYKTALLYIDGVNVCSMYPSPKDPVNFWTREIKDWCSEYNHPISDARATELATYMIENIR